MMKGSLIATILLVHFSCADALEEGKLCYILDGILVLYGIILTALYCRLRMRPVYVNTTTNYPQKPPNYGEGIYSGLTPHGQDTYETIKVEKKPIV